MTFDANGLMAVALAFFIVTVSPGPANIAVAIVAMRSGRRAGLLIGAGLAVGLAFWGLVAATGLGAVLQGSVYALTALKVAGGLYLIWLAIQSLRTAVRPMANAKKTAGEGKWFWRGLILNLSNPKAVLAWMAALSMGLTLESGGAFVALATGLCMVLGLINYTLYALAFSLPGFMAGYHKLSRWIEGAVAGFFAFMGFGLLRSAFER